MPSRQDQEGARAKAGATAQHIALIGLDEATCQGLRCHAVTSCFCVGLRPNDGHMPQRSVAQVHNERRLPGCTTRV